MKLPFVKDKPWPEEHPYTWYQAYPRYLYHNKLAPEGKIFKSPEETVGLKRKGWVDNPAKFPKPSKLKPWWEEREWSFKAVVTLVSILGGIVTILGGIVALVRR
jgi:hypothetical protein